MNELGARRIRNSTDPRVVLKRALVEADRRYSTGSAVAALGYLEGVCDYVLLLLGDKEHWDSRLKDVR